MKVKKFHFDMNAGQCALSNYNSKVEQKGQPYFNITPTGQAT